MKLPTIHIDFETRSAADLKSFGAHKYAEHPTTDFVCLAFAIDDGPVFLYRNPKIDPRGNDAVTEMEFRDALLMIRSRQCEVVAHNAPFELAIWNSACVPKHGWTPLPPETCVCTMAMAYAMSVPASLEKCGAALGLTNRKDTAGARMMMQVAQPKEGPDPQCVACGGEGGFSSGENCACVTWWEEKEKLDVVYAYCRQDVAVEREVEKRLLRLSPAERKVWALDYKINARGIAVDLGSAATAIEIVEIETERLNRAMRETTGGEVAGVAAVAQLTRWISSRGVECDGVAKADILALLERGDLPVDVRQALLIRQEGAKSSTAKLEAFIKGTCDDGRMRGLFQYHGANTGRWAGRRAQLQNLPRPSLDHNAIDEVFELLGEA